MSKIVCPYCFDTFERNEVMFRCSNESGCKKGDDPELHKFWGNIQNECPSFKPKFSFGSLLGNMPESAKCPQCGEKSYLVICPHCHNRIPKHMVKEKGYIISIIGARSSGKTNYITTLINELFHYGHCLGNIGTTASAVANKPENNTQERYERDFFNIMYKNSKCPPQTDINDPKNRIPLIYELGQQGKSPIYLVFYDTAGENFANPKNIASNVKFLNQSDAVIFLLDTFSIPYVHDKLKAPMGLSDIELKYDKIISNLITHFEEGDRHIRDAHYKKPMALVFSKIDAILKNDELFQNTAIPGMSIERNSSFLDGSGVNLSDIDSISDGIRAGLNSWNEQNFINSMENHYKNVKYFGISALGGMPDKTGRINNLRPYRVLDPLVWILHQFKYSLPIVK